MSVAYLPALPNRPRPYECRCDECRQPFFSSFPDSHTCPGCFVTLDGPYLNDDEGDNDADH